MRLSATSWTIVQAAQAGDEEAIRSLCEKYRPALVSYMRRRGLGEEAEDVTQEALFGLVQGALASADGARGRFRALVFAIGRNHLAKFHERGAAAKRGKGRVHPIGDQDFVASGPSGDFDREWLAAIVQNCLQRLRGANEDYYDALRLFALEGLPQAEIARRLDVRVGVVKKRVFRGKRKLADFLREEVWRYSASPDEYEVELRYLSGFLGT
ncbi:MAG: sigma-70 family RNA polymerase sigma factor [Planctomycetes bacterium]|nr:sigma-70 family RNA polymerase sigma factor [Planctomycetota bacterium]